MVAHKPLAEKEQNYIEIFNEAVIMVSCHCVNAFLNIGIPLSARDTLGWVLMGFIALNVSVNIGIIIYHSLMDFFIVNYTWYMMSKVTANLL